MQLNSCRVILSIAVVLLTVGSYYLNVEGQSIASSREMERLFGSTLAPSEYTQQARLVSGFNGDSFSASVGISGNTVVAYSTSGFLVFVRSGNTWVQQAILIPSDGMSVAASDKAVSIDGNAIVIGGSGAVVNGVSQGAAYVFVRTGAIWTEHQRLLANDGAAGDSFGKSVAIKGESIVVGASSDDVGANANQGSAYVFIRSGGIWSEQSKLLASDGSDGHGFGLGTAIDGDTTIVSSRIGSVNGSIYVFVRTQGIWTEQQRLSVCESSGSNGIACNFGSTISVSADTIAAGNRSLNVNGSISQGGVYIFVRNGTVWTQEQRITAADGLASEGFGVSVAISGNSLVVRNVAAVSPGAIYVYERSGSTWFQSQPRIAFPTQSASVGLSGKVSSSEGSFVFGIVRDLVPPEGAIGAAYIFNNPSLSLVTLSGRVMTPASAGLRSAKVILTDSQGVRRTATTSTFGYFSFEHVPTGTYTIGVFSRRYRFTPRDITLTGDLTDVDFVGQE